MPWCGGVGAEAAAAADGSLAGRGSCGEASEVQKSAPFAECLTRPEPASRGGSLKADHTGRTLNAHLISWGPAARALPAPHHTRASRPAPRRAAPPPILTRFTFEINTLVAASIGGDRPGERVRSE